MSTSDFSNLIFFKTDKYEQKYANICDFSDIPRPHFCMGLILEGTGVFSQSNENDITVHPGEIIFVPITARYISKWHGNPNITYISIHFAFAPSRGISEKDHFKLQKIIPQNCERILNDYLFIFENQNSDNLSKKYAVLSRFYQVMSEIIPLLSQNEDIEYDERINKIAEFIDMNSEKNMSVSELADICNMSVSNLHTLFKKFKGTTPVEYRNSARISRAMRILKSNRQISVEELSCLLGFDSTTYFRRTFKKIVGKTPREYRNSDMEL